MAVLRRLRKTLECASLRSSYMKRMQQASTTSLSDLATLSTSWTKSTLRAPFCRIQPVTSKSIRCLWLNPKNKRPTNSAKRLSISGIRDIIKRLLKKHLLPSQSLWSKRKLSSKLLPNHSLLLTMKSFRQQSHLCSMQRWKVLKVFH